MHLSVKRGCTARRAGHDNGGGPRPFEAGGHRHGAAKVPYRNELISIVSVRPGPTPIAEIGAPDISSSAFT
ncbi:hypothetical protein GCM10010231_28090 [Streptomyces sindenensis]|nr:hypothetical protein GCM10010231_28090 [Streptomyces sindenensis]